jgi:hypothetical protein
MAMQKAGRRPIRIGLMFLDSFLGVTAVLGGLGLLLRVPLFSPPLDLLGGSPFGSYAIPGLALLILVGGVACWRCSSWRGARAGVRRCLPWRE